LEVDIHQTLLARTSHDVIDINAVSLGFETPITNRPDPQCLPHRLALGHPFNTVVETEDHVAGEESIEEFIKCGCLAVPSHGDSPERFPHVATPMQPDVPCSINQLRGRSRRDREP
jgi:hypothetical protein